MDENRTGVVLLGGAHGALSAARSFGRKGISVFLVTDDHPLPKLSRYVTRRFGWPRTKSPDTVDWLLRFADEEGTRGWLLLPCGDPEVRLVAENLDRLRTAFDVVSLDWAVLQKVCDKQQLAETAAAAGVAFPKSYAIRSLHDASSAQIQFPVALKPAMRLERNPFTAAKAWRADSQEEFVRLYRDASAYVGAENVVVQELIPGGGEAQLSYTGVWVEGRPVADMTARRTRQYPVEFSFSSTFVEAIDNEPVKIAARKLLAAIGFEGLVEVEFKYDARDAVYKVLDVNPRTWSWLELCPFCGFDFPPLLRDALAGRSGNQPVPNPGPRAWIHLSRDLAVALQLIRRGDLTPAGYLRSLGQRLTFGAFAWDDPLPGVLELPLTLWRVMVRKLSFRREL
ncbi:MAG: ATP-grasp domain-containing protein [Xanthobacteraceae bacterium]|nr:ATP-grasp domain-containing protein [Xanthobacteraceae bacterium]